MENVQINKKKFILHNAWGHTPQKVGICVCPDKNGILPECVRQIDDKGNMILSEKDKELQSQEGKIFIKINEIFTIQDGDMFNLDIESNRVKWDCIKNSPWISKEGRFARDSNNNLIIDGNTSSDLNKRRYGRANFYVEYENEVAISRTSRRERLHKAYDYIIRDRDDYGKERLIKRVRLLGRQLPDNIELVDVADILFTEAEKNPDSIITLYEDDAWAVKLIIYEAVDKRIISCDNGRYTYTGQFLGSNVNGIVDFLQDSRNAIIRDNLFSEVSGNNEIGDNLIKAIAKKDPKKDSKKTSKGESF